MRRRKVEGEGKRKDERRGGDEQRGWKPPPNQSAPNPIIKGQGIKTWCV